MAGTGFFPSLSGRTELTLLETATFKLGVVCPQYTSANRPHATTRSD